MVVATPQYFDLPLQCVLMFIDRQHLLAKMSSTYYIYTLIEVTDSRSSEYMTQIDTAAFRLQRTIII